MASQTDHVASLISAGQCPVGAPDFALGCPARMQRPSKIVRPNTLEQPGRSLRFKGQGVALDTANARCHPVQQCYPKPPIMLAGDRPVATEWCYRGTKGGITYVESNIAFCPLQATLLNLSHPFFFLSLSSCRLISCSPSCTLLNALAGSRPCALPFHKP